MRTTFNGSTSHHPTHKQFLINGEELEHRKYHVQVNYLAFLTVDALSRLFCGYFISLIMFAQSNTV